MEPLLSRAGLLLELLEQKKIRIAFSDAPYDVQLHNLENVQSVITKLKAEMKTARLLGRPRLMLVPSIKGL